MNIAKFETRLKELLSEYKDARTTPCSKQNTEQKKRWFEFHNKVSELSNEFDKQ